MKLCLTYASHPTTAPAAAPATAPPSPNAAPDPDSHSPTAAEADPDPVADSHSGPRHNSMAAGWGVDSSVQATIKSENHLGRRRKVMSKGVRRAAKVQSLGMALQGRERVIDRVID